MKRKPKKPVYTHARSSFTGIEERLALASLAFSKTWKPTPHEQDSYRFNGEYMHSVRFFSKKEGWECNFTWRDDCKYIDLNQYGVKRAIAHGIEFSRTLWWEDQHSSKELLAILAAAQARKVAA